MSTEQTGWRSDKVKRPREVVAPYANALKQWFENQGLTVELGGSFRRGAAMVGDVDVVIQTESLEPSLLQPGVKFPDKVRWDRMGPQVAQGSLVLPDGSELHIDVWAATAQQWGAFLWFITGPKELNIEMRRLALRKGMNLSQIGLLRTEDKVQLDDGTERDVALKLGFPWLEPTDRQRYAEPQQTSFSTKVQGSKGAEYTVRLEGGAWHCTCPSFTYRGQECKHIKAVKLENPSVQPILTVRQPSNPLEGL